MAIAKQINSGYTEGLKEACCSIQIKLVITAIFDGGAVYCHISHRNRHLRSDMLVTDVHDSQVFKMQFSQNQIHSTQVAGVGILLSVLSVFVYLIVFS